jgi:hypothetical protein
MNKRLLIALQKHEEYVLRRAKNQFSEELNQYYAASRKRAEQQRIDRYWKLC